MASPRARPAAQRPRNSFACSSPSPTSTAGVLRAPARERTRSSARTSSCGTALPSIVSCRSEPARPAEHLRNRPFGVTLTTGSDGSVPCPATVPVACSGAYRGFSHLVFHGGDDGSFRGQRAARTSSWPALGGRGQAAVEVCDRSRLAGGVYCHRALSPRRLMQVDPVPHELFGISRPLLVADCDTAL